MAREVRASLIAMGNRAQIYIPDHDIYFYTHWGGHSLREVLANALARGRSRWHDDSYLARIIFSEMIRGEVTETTGYGINSEPALDARYTLHVDIDENRVGEGGYETAQTWVSFEDWVEQHASVPTAEV